jgi:hypothetical protein
MNHPPSRTNLPRNCTFDPSDWRILARSWFPVAIAAQAAATWPESMDDRAPATPEKYKSTSPRMTPRTTQKHHGQ